MYIIIAVFGRVGAGLWSYAFAGCAGILRNAWDFAGLVVLVIKTIDFLKEMRYNGSIVYPRVAHVKFLKTFSLRLSDASHTTRYGGISFEENNFAPNGTAGVIYFRLAVASADGGTQQVDGKYDTKH